jgi:hypothetical protein
MCLLFSYICTSVEAGFVTPQLTALISSPQSPLPENTASDNYRKELQGIIPHLMPPMPPMPPAAWISPAHRRIQHIRTPQPLRPPTPHPSSEAGKAEAAAAAAPLIIPTSPPPMPSSVIVALADVERMIKQEPPSPTSYEDEGSSL